MIEMSSVDLATGLWLLCLPVPVLMRMHASMARRLILIVLFVAGGFASIAAAIQIPFIIAIDVYDFSGVSSLLRYGLALSLMLGTFKNMVPANLPSLVVVITVDII